MDAVTTNLNELGRVLGLYAKAAGLTFEEAIAKKAVDLSYALYAEFRGLTPAKGAVRAERLAALKDGEGVRVRPRVYEWIRQKYGALPLAVGVMRWRTKGGQLRGTTRRGLNLQALAVERELNLRESGRVFLAHTAKPEGIERSDFVRVVGIAKSRYGPWLSKLLMSRSTKGPEARFEWGEFSELSNAAVHAIGRTRGMAAVARAIRAVTEDMIPYIESHLNVTAKQMGVRV